MSPRVRGKIRFDPWRESVAHWSLGRRTRARYGAWNGAPTMNGVWQSHCTPPRALEHPPPPPLRSTHQQDTQKTHEAHDRVPEWFRGSTATRVTPVRIRSRSPVRESRGSAEGGEAARSGPLPHLHFPPQGPPHGQVGPKPRPELRGPIGNERTEPDLGTDEPLSLQVGQRLLSRRGRNPELRRQLHHTGDLSARRVGALRDASSDHCRGGDARAPGPRPAPAAAAPRADTSP